MTNYDSTDMSALQRRDQILSAVGFVANTLLQSSDWRDAIDVVLQRLGVAIGANRAYYFENHLSPDGVQLTSQRVEWAAPGIQAQIDNQDLQDLSWSEAGVERWLELLKQRKPVYGLIADFPESERGILESQQIQSLIVMPVFVQDKLNGFVGFDDCESLREWSLAEIDALYSAATALGAAIQRQRLEHQLRFAQKMEAVGTLAAGVAHEFNNMLQVIAGLTELAQLKIGDDSEAQKDLREVQLATEQAHGLTQQLLMFTQERESQSKNIDLKQLAESVMRMIHPTLGHAITVSHDFSSVPLVINADSALVRQILVNLCLNARDAMPDGGQLEVSCGRRLLGGRDSEFTETDLEGEYAILSVKDTGVGIPAQIRDRIFEPFFTTKKQGDGTGLGLSVAFGSVQQCGGFIQVRSQPDQGAQFDVFFPLFTEAV